jgi:hypothetical protein
LLKTINVTAECIADGEKSRCDRCPIALAVQQAFPDHHLVFVNATSVRVYSPDEWYRADLPDDGVEFVTLFDASEPVGPFTMELDFVDPQTTTED